MDRPSVRRHRRPSHGEADGHEPDYSETSAPKYFSPSSASTPSSRSSVERGVDRGDEVGLVLRERERAQRRVVGLGGDLEARLAVGLHVVEVGELVVDGRVDAALLSSATAWAQPSTASTFAPDSWASSYQLLVSDCAVVLPARSSKLEIERVALVHDDDARRDGVGLAEEVLLLALGVDRDLVRDHVEPARVEAREDRVPLGLLELDLEAELVGDRLGDLDVVADEVAEPSSWKLNGR